MSTPTQEPASGNSPLHEDRSHECRENPGNPGDHGGTGPLLSQRVAMILLLAVLCGVGAVLLLTWAGQHPGMAIVSGVVGAAGAIAFFNSMIGR